MSARTRCRNGVEPHCPKCRLWVSVDLCGYVLPHSRLGARSHGVLPAAACTGTGLAAKWRNVDEDKPAHRADEGNPT